MHLLANHEEAWLLRLLRLLGLQRPLCGRPCRRRAVRRRGRACVAARPAARQRHGRQPGDQSKELAIHIEASQGDAQPHGKAAAAGGQSAHAVACMGRGCRGGTADVGDMKGRMQVHLLML